MYIIELDSRYISILNKYHFYICILTFNYRYISIVRELCRLIDNCIPSIHCFVRVILLFSFIVVFHHGIEILDCTHSKPSTSENVGELLPSSDRFGSRREIFSASNFLKCSSCRDPIIGTDPYA